MRTFVVTFKNKELEPKDAAYRMVESGEHTNSEMFNWLSQLANLDMISVESIKVKDE